MFGKPAPGGGAPMTSPRPMANPGMATMGTPPIRPESGGGMFPGLSPQKRYDMAMELLQQGMASASGSGNPLLSFISPFAGAVIGGNLQGKADAAASAGADEMNQTLLGTMAGDPRARGYLDILNNPDAPDYARSMAKDGLTKLMAPPKPAGRAGGSGGTRARFPGRAPGNTDALLSTMFYRAMDPESDGGETVTPGEQAKMETLKNMRSRSSSVDYSYGNTEAPADDDPLGIR